MTYGTRRRCCGLPRASTSSRSRSGSGTAATCLTLDHVRRLPYLRRRRNPLPEPISAHRADNERGAAAPDRTGLASAALVRGCLSLPAEPGPHLRRARRRRRRGTPGRTPRTADRPCARPDQLGGLGAGGRICGMRLGGGCCSSPRPMHSPVLAPVQGIPWISGTLPGAGAGIHTPGGGVMHLTHLALGYRCRRAGRWYGEDGDRRGSQMRDRKSTGKD